MFKLGNTENLNKVFSTLKRYWLLVFYGISIAYLELIYRLWTFKSLGLDYIFPVVFAISAGGVMFLISCMFKDRINKILSISITLLIILGYGLQLIYYDIFRTPLSIYSVGGAEDALQFKDIILSSISKNYIALFLIFLPLIILLSICKRLTFFKRKYLSLHYILIFCIASYTIAMVMVNMTDEKTLSQRTLYYNTSSPELSVLKLGLLTTMRLDFERLFFGIEQKYYQEEITNQEHSDASIAEAFGPSDEVVLDASISEQSIEEGNQPIEFNTIEIDFDALTAKEENQALVEMHKYFSLVKPTKKNEYTGLFAGNNLILITAEAFSSYAIDPELTPTLYKMSTEGFVFNNFYNPLWGVSTSDGEYVACTGLIPKSGIWSMARSGKNYLPFVMGNQFKELGYITKAYHNHSYTYYKRNVSHPNMGYDYKGIGNGLKIKKTWPESDIEMIEATAGEYISSEPFHTYYMTVSGHMNYNFTGNYIALKNKALVEHLPYSDASKAYIACNLELEFAMKSLIDKLEAAGIADKTVIAISADHYPYGLPKEGIDELAGYKVEENFELYKSTFILWKKGMEPILVDKTCSSLDIIPTLSNLFGLKYDSRLLMGKDILSDEYPLVVFSNRSWITDRARYNTLTNIVTYIDGAQEDSGYIEEINNIVNDKFIYSAKILETDYYKVLMSGIKESGLSK